MNDAGPDWVAWHARYDEEGSSLRERLAVVQRFIIEAFARIERSPIRVISMCAGQARDLSGAIEQSGRRDVVGRLVEINPVLADQARASLNALGVTEVEVVTGDAGLLSAYEGAAPADLVLECGVFGNVSDEDVERTLRSSTALCAHGATLIWTRHRRPPDLTVEIRRWLAESGFENTAYEAVDDPERQGAVGVAIFRGTPLPIDRRLLFTFDNEMVTRRAEPTA